MNSDRAGICRSISYFTSCVKLPKALARPAGCEQPFQRHCLNRDDLSARVIPQVEAICFKLRAAGLRRLPSATLLIRGAVL